MEFLWPSLPVPLSWSSAAAAGGASSPTDSTSSLLPPQGDERDANGGERHSHKDDRPVGAHRRLNEGRSVVRGVDETDQFVNPYREDEHCNNHGDKRYDQTACGPLHDERRE